MSALTVSIFSRPAADSLPLPSGEGRGGGAADQFEALAKPYFPHLYHYAMGMTRNTDDAEDLTQEALLKAFQSFHQFQPGTNFRAWLITIARNCYINAYRSRRAAPATVS